MFDQINVELDEAREQVRRFRELQQVLAPARERLGERGYALRGLEVLVGQLEGEIASLEGATLRGFFQSLLGQKDHKLQELREQLEAAASRFEEEERAVAELDQQVKAMEEEFQALAGAEQRYANLVEDKKRRLLEMDQGDGGRLAELSRALDGVKAYRQAVRRASQIGRHLLERLEVMVGSLGRADRQKVYGGGALGALGNTVVNAMARHGAEGNVSRARQGLEEFSECVAALPLDPARERDQELLRLGQLVGAQAVELPGRMSCDTAVAQPMAEAIQNALGLLDSILAEVEATVSSLESECVELVEAA